jgi:hypothetical protein
MLLFIQGGVHWKWRAVPFWRDIWTKVLDNPVVKECAKQKKLTLIRSGYTVTITVFGYSLSSPINEGGSIV